MTDKEMAEIAERELSRLGIGDFIKKNVKQLSGGQKRRVSIGIELLSPSPYLSLMSRLQVWMPLVIVISYVP